MFETVRRDNCRWVIKHHNNLPINQFFLPILKLMTGSSVGTLLKFVGECNICCLQRFYLRQLA